MHRTPARRIANGRFGAGGPARALARRGGIIVDRLEAALDSVRWYADHGYYGIKIHNPVTPDGVRPLADEAHRLGLKVTGRVPAFMGPEPAIRDGYDEITHVNQLMLGFIIDAEREDARTPRADGRRRLLPSGNPRDDGHTAVRDRARRAEP